MAHGALAMFLVTKWLSHDLLLYEFELCKISNTKKHRSTRAHMISLALSLLYVPLWKRKSFSTRAAQGFLFQMRTITHGFFRQVMIKDWNKSQSNPITIDATSSPNAPSKPHAVLHSISCTNYVSFFTQRVKEAKRVDTENKGGEGKNVAAENRVEEDLLPLCFRCQLFFLLPLCFLRPYMQRWVLLLCREHANQGFPEKMLTCLLFSP